MTITTTDIKLLASARMADTVDGGGRMTGTVIQDGVDNNMFDDVSNLDRVYGRISLRKGYCAILTNTRDKYLGARAIIDAGPTDTNVSATIFSTGSISDTRADAANRVESYLNSASVIGHYLLDNHITGQSNIQLFSRPGTAPPSPGETLYIVWHEGQGDQKAQYVRVTSTSAVVNTYTDGVGDFTGQVTSCNLSDVLRYDFTGSPASRYYTPLGVTASYVKGTVVADAGSYRGISNLALAAAIGDTQIKVGSIYSQLLPGSRSEISALDQMPANAVTVSLAATPRAVTVPASPHTQRIKIGPTNRGFNFVSMLAPLPASGTVTCSYLAFGKWYTIRDNGDGTMSGSGTGTINYLTGSISVTLQAMPDVRSSVIFTWGERLSFTSHAGDALFKAPEFAFDLEHRGIVPSSVTITWMSGAVLKTATDNGSGAFTGDATGNISYTTGSVQLKPTAFMDANGEFAIDYSYKSVVQETKTGLTPSGGGLVTFSLGSVPTAGSIVVEWITTRTASATSGMSLAAGNSTKSSSTTTDTVSRMAATSKLVGYPSALTAGWLAATLPAGGNTTPGAAVTGFAGEASAIASGVYAPVYPGGMGDTRVCTSTVTRDVSGSTSSKLTSTSSQTSNLVVSTFHEITENGIGGFVGGLGTINYAGQSVTLQVVNPSSTSTTYKNDTESAADFAAMAAGAYVSSNYGPANSNNATNGGGGSSTAQGGTYGTRADVEVFDNTALQVTYSTGAGGPTAHSMTYTPVVTTIDLVPHTTERVVPGSVLFTWMGHTYQDFEGVLYRDRTVGFAGYAAGTINYSTGIAYVKDYIVSGSPTSFTLDSCWTSKGTFTTSKVYFRTPTAPVKPTGIVMSILGIDGTPIIATGGSDGKILGDHTVGQIDYEVGTCDVVFGDLVLDTSLTAAEKLEWWYAAAYARISSEGKVWKPWPVDPGSLRYNVVSYFYLPLDATTLGLDPVRLPQDGRVPIFKAGHVLVVHDTVNMTPVTVANTDVIDTTRVRLARLRVFGSNGLEITSGFTTDLDAGTVTFTNVAGYSQPVTIEHRIEDEALCSDMQIGGELKLTRPLTHNFTTNAKVSSVLIVGDLQADATEGFSQGTWTSVWQDTRIGSAITPQYNQTLYPIVTTNQGAIAERWACIFTNTTTFNIVGEDSGVIGTGTTATPTAPNNPATGVPYFTISEVGWGTGWSVGNVFRFNTRAANFPIWCARTVIQSPAAPPGTDQLTLSIRGDVDV